MKPRRPIVVAHRGLGFGHPENTLRAFEAVRRHGSVGVELDARITRDGVAVVCHDPDARLASGARVAISTADLSELDGAVPTLAETLRTLGDEVLVDLEIKPTGEAIEPVLAAIGSSRVRLSSFSSTVLEQARQKAPAIPRALLLEPEDDAAKSIAVATLLGAEGVHAHRTLLSPAYVQGWRAAGLAVRGYTLNDPDEWAQAADLRIDAIITDRPLELEDWLSDAGAA